MPRGTAEVGWSRDNCPRESTAVCTFHPIKSLLLALEIALFER